MWYAAYGSNLFEYRFSYYREGGSLPGTSRTYPGFRDPTPPVATRPLTLPGTVYFAGDSPVWTGGTAFYARKPAHGWPAGAAVRGYLITPEQFGDLLAQEMHRQPGDTPGPDLDEVLDTGVTRVGDGRYETVLHVADVAGYPVLTFTAPCDADDVEPSRPAPRYLSMLAAGLRESHGWSRSEVVSYLAALPGVDGRWRREDRWRLGE